MSFEKLNPPNGRTEEYTKQFDSYIDISVVPPPISIVIKLSFLELVF